MNSETVISIRKRLLALPDNATFPNNFIIIYKLYNLTNEEIKIGLGEFIKIIYIGSLDLSKVIYRRTLETIYSYTSKLCRTFYLLILLYYSFVFSIL